ncbi:MAG: diguanylate cyclase [Pseudomonadota bacterium]
MISDIDYSQESVLVVDDELSVREIVEGLFMTLGFKVHSVPDGPEALEKLGTGEYTFMLTDMKMPKLDGLELIKKVSQVFPHINIIAMTGYSDEYKYVDVINAGACDFIKKPFDIDELEAKIRRAINERTLRKELEKLIITDSLTGLYNQRHFYTRLREEIKRVKRQGGHPISLIFIDLDYFKTFNDTYGHLAGDDVLRSVGQTISKSIREGVDSGYRYGGDEFAIILIDSQLPTAKEIGKRIQNALIENKKITASMGYAQYSNGMSFEELVSIADKNLYQDKINNRIKQIV